MSSIADQLKNMNVGKLKMKNGQTYEEMLKKEVIKLKQYVDDEIALAYMSYYPKVYHRTNRFRHSTYVSDDIQYSANGKQITMYVRFNDLAWHNSLWNGSDGYLPLLWSEGWAWKDQSNPRERFTYWGGNSMLETAIEKYKMDNPLGLDVRIEKY
ncbi:MAG: hypothetical protein PHT99_11830 [Methanoregula sp.]|nr:hypothetical protein [Methanoregula sp.]